MQELPASPVVSPAPAEVSTRMSSRVYSASFAVSRAPAEASARMERPAPAPIGIASGVGLKTEEGNAPLAPPTPQPSVVTEPKRPAPSVTVKNFREAAGQVLPGSASASAVPLAAEGPAPVLFETPPPVPRAVRPETARGTPAAKDGSAMKDTEVLNKFAQRGTQPEAGSGTALASASFAATAGVEAGSEKFASKVTFSTEMLAGLKTAPVPNRFDERVSMETSAPVAPVSAPRELALEVTRHVAELKQLNLDSLAVVLRPDPNTELFLHLKRHNGGVDIQAQFERGDFQQLNAQWGELQSSLAAQGIRVSALEGSGFNSSQAPMEQQAKDSHGPPPDRGEREPAHEPFEELLPDLPVAATAPRSPFQPRTSPSRQWESWA